MIPSNGLNSTGNSLSYFSGAYAASEAGVNGEQETIGGCVCVCVCVCKKWLVKTCAYV